MGVLGQEKIPNEVLKTADVTSHWYGKGVKPGRKMGHIHVSGESLQQLGNRLAELTSCLPEQDYPGVFATSKSLL